MSFKRILFTNQLTFNQILSLYLTRAYPELRIPAATPVIVTISA
jgi:hypothetical protein